MIIDNNIKSTQKPIKILHIFGRMNRGGAEMRTLDIMRRINKDKYRLEYCALSGLSGSLDEEVCRLGGRVHPINIYSFSFPWEFIKLLRANRFDVVHSHVRLTSGYILWLAAIANVPSRIAHFRSSEDGQKDTIRRRIQRRVMHSLVNRFSTQILAVSKASMTATWGAQWQQDPRCKVIYNGIDLSLFSRQPEQMSVYKEFGIPEQAVLYIHVGRFHTVKNHQKTVSVFAEIEKQCPTAYLLLVGQGNNKLESAIRQQVNDLNISNKVLFIGERTDVPRLLQAAHAMLFPSYYEGLPGAVLEASAVGLPVIASDIPVIKEIAPKLLHLNYLPLAASNTLWAKTAIKTAVNGKQSNLRQVTKNAFLHSEFSLDACIRSNEQTWTI